MQVVTFALAAAVLTALAYTVLTERATYASVRRRQLDAWAAIAAMICLFFLFSGGQDVRRAYERRQALAAAVPTPVLAIARRAPVSLRTPSPETIARPDGAVVRPATDRAIDAPGDAAAPSQPQAEAPRTRPSDRTDRPMAPALDGGKLGNAVADVPNLQAFGTGVPAQSTLSALSPTEVRRIIVSGPPTPSAPTAGPPSPMPDTPVPPATVTPPPSATPDCGEPDDIDLAITVRDARADRGDGELVVRYRVEVSNAAGFPVTLANINITALNSAGGSETYGHATRPDMTVGAGASVTLEGGLRLDRSPGPFGRTELCVSLAADTCGRRSRYEAFRRCSTVNGF